MEKEGGGLGQGGVREEQQQPGMWAGGARAGAGAATMGTALTTMMRMNEMRMIGVVLLTGSSSSSSSWKVRGGGVIEGDRVVGWGVKGVPRANKGRVLQGGKMGAGVRKE